VKQFQQAGFTAVSVDTKKKQISDLKGNFFNAGCPISLANLFQYPFGSGLSKRQKNPLPFGERGGVRI